MAEAAVDAGGGGDAALPEAGTDAGGAQDAGERACDGPSGCLIGTIPVSARDIVHDAKRDLLYITTSPSIGGDGSVLRWDLAQSRFLDPLLSGGQFLGIDLSPDQKLLAIADGAADGSSNWVHLIDLETGSRRKLSFTLDFYEAGTYTVVFLSDSTLLVSSSFAGSGWTPLRKVDLVTGEAQSVRSVRQGTMLALSADGSAVAYAESNEIPGTFGRYDPATGGIGGTTVPWFVYEACISRDAKQLATPTYGGTYVFDAQFTPLATIGLYADKMPIGCVYSPVADRLYFAWMSFDAQQPSLDVYDTKTLTRVRPIDPNIGLFDWVGNGAFNQGRLRMSRDGSLLFSTQRARVGIYRVAGGA